MFKLKEKQKLLSYINVIYIIITVYLKGKEKKKIQYNKIYNTYIIL